MTRDEIVVVEENDDAIGGQVAVRLDVHRTGRVRGRHRGERVLDDAVRDVVRRQQPAVGEDPRPRGALEPAVRHDSGGAARSSCGVAGCFAGFDDGRGERGAHALERLRELARDDPELARRAVGDLRQRLQVLVGEQLVVGVADVDRVEDRLDGLGLTLGAQDGGLLVALGARGSRPAVRPPRSGSRTASCPRR